MKLLIHYKTFSLHHWSSGMEKKSNLTLYWACDYLSMLGLKLSHVSERGPGVFATCINSWHFSFILCIDFTSAHCLSTSICISILYWWLTFLSFLLWATYVLRKWWLHWQPTDYIYGELITKIFSLAELLQNTEYIVINVKSHSSLN